MLLTTIASTMLAGPVGGEFEYGIIKMVDRQDFAYNTFVFPEDLNPTDLNEDGATDFADLMIVLSDVAAGKYKNDGYNALLAVLSGWGPNQ